MALITLVWCGVTGAFAAYIGVSISKHLHAKRHFRAAEGVVISSRIETHTDDDEDTTYSPSIKYRYTVGGTAYTSTRYAYGMGSTSDHGYARGIVDQYPAGARIAVYYDPDDPAESLLHLEVPAIQYFQRVFVQPFVPISHVLLGYTATLPRRMRRVREFRQGRMEVPCTIPTWGELRPAMGGVAIRGGIGKPAAALAAAAVGYTLTCFVSIFILALGFGIGRVGASVVATVFTVAAGVGAAAGLFTLSLPAKRKARLHIDRTLGRLSLTSRRRDVRLALDEVVSWKVKSIPAPQRVGTEHGSLPAPLLAVATADGREVPIHVFRPDHMGAVIAAKVGRGLADLTGKPVEVALSPPPQADRKTPENFGEVIALVRRAAWAGKEYDDLT